MGDIPGNKGKPHSEKTKRKMSNILKGRHSSPRTEFKEGHLPVFAISGKRKDLNNTFFRSRWEANYARYLNFLKIKWEYEPKTFWFKKVKRGTMTYTPDFYLSAENRFVEIKGWFNNKTKTKLRRFKKDYPKEFKRLILVVRSPWSESKADIERMKFLEKLEVSLDRIEDYKEIEDKLGALIPNWE